MCTKSKSNIVKKPMSMWEYVEWCKFRCSSCGKIAESSDRYFSRWYRKGVMQMKKIRAEP